MSQQATQAEELLTELKKFIKSHKGHIAIGVDMAASEKKWGICVLAVSSDLETADLRLLLPQAKRNKDNSPSPTLHCHPSFVILKTILQLVADSGQSGSMGVDVPFGWPAEHSRFVEGWSALHAWTKEGRLPDRSSFEKRLTDVKLNQYESSIAPFAVGADTIAQAAYKWANCRCGLSTLTGTIDFGLGHSPTSTTSGITSFESYPGAFVNLRYPEHGNYKSKPDVRSKLLISLKREYAVQSGDRENGWLDWAIQQKGSPDAFDAFLCAITAWGHLRWRSNPDAHPMTTPDALLGTPVSDVDKERIQREGWILVPSRNVSQ